MDLSLVETNALIDELKTRFSAFALAAEEKDNPDADNYGTNPALYVWEGRTVACIGLCRLMEHYLIRQRNYSALEDDE